MVRLKHYLGKKKGAGDSRRTSSIFYLCIIRCGCEECGKQIDFFCAFWCGCSGYGALWHHVRACIDALYLVWASIVEAQIADGGDLGVQDLLFSLQLLLHLAGLGEGLGHRLVVVQISGGGQRWQHICWNTDRRTHRVRVNNTAGEAGMRSWAKISHKVSQIRGEK